LWNSLCDGKVENSLSFGFPRKQTNASFEGHIYIFPSWCWQPILILVNWNPCSTWFHFEFSFHSAPSCILIAFAYCTDHKCIKPGQNSQLMLPHIRIPIRIRIRTHIRRLVMAIVYCLFIALLINYRLYLCQFFRPSRPHHLFPCQFVCTCPFLWMTWGLVNNTCKLAQWVKKVCAWKLITSEVRKLQKSKMRHPLKIGWTSVNVCKILFRYWKSINVSLKIK